MSHRYELTKGIFKENPTFIIMLGMCPTLGVTTQVFNAFGMGASVLFVLLGSNIFISALRKIIPDSIRIPAYIVVIASFVTIVEMVLHAFVPAVFNALGVYLPLIVVNCIILGRAEAFANKNTVLDSALDAIGMGIGFTLALSLIAAIREIFGAGTITLFNLSETHISKLSSHGTVNARRQKEREHDLYRNNHHICVHPELHSGTVHGTLSFYRRVEEQ